MRRVEDATVIDKTVAGVATAVADVGDVATVMIGRFGTAGMPGELIDALFDELQRMSVVLFNRAAVDDVVLGCANGAGEDSPRYRFPQ